MIYAIILTEEEAKNIKDIYDVFEITNSCNCGDWDNYENLNAFKQYIIEEDEDPIYAVIDTDEKSFHIYDISIKREVVMKYIPKRKTTIKSAKK
jgi:hypothetical protein